MRTIETTATVTEQGTLTLQVPPGIPPGSHRVVVVIEEPSASAEDLELSEDVPEFDVGPWPADLSLRREDMYGDWGR